MRIFSVSSALLATFGVVCARSTTPTSKSIARSALEVFETLYEVPQGWTRHERPDPSTLISLRVDLEMPDHALFEKTLYTISTPDHPDYGKHLSHAELKRLVKPRDSTTQGVLEWLDVSGVQASDMVNNDEWIAFRISVANAEKMLGTTFHYYTQDGDKAQTKQVRTLQYSVPRGLKSHIAMVEPTTRFGQLKPHFSQPFLVSKNDGSGEFEAIPVANLGAPLNATFCNTTITPDCLRALYNVGDYHASPHRNSLFGVTGYLNQWAKYAPLDFFLKKYAPYAVNQTFEYVLINGGQSTQNSTVFDDREANLDMQYAASLGYRNPIKFYSTAGNGPLVPDLDQPSQDNNQNEPYLDFVTYLSNLPDDELPQTLTTSYGEDEQSVPEKYSKTVCNMFGKLGLRGVSILFSSGDTGVGSACQTNDGKNTTRFLPIFPAACPYVTSVGGTYNVQPERAVYFSSGGFSDRWARPSYQDDAVKDYLKILGTKQWKGFYNPKGRGFPDVAAQGLNFRIIEQNYTTGAFVDKRIGGTSASAPTFAAIISLLNNARLKAKDKPLGFLNPWLYSKALPGLNDITLGGSTGCTGVDAYSGLTTPIVPYASWNATKGWDPVTGLGTPNFKTLLAISAGKY